MDNINLPEKFTIDNLNDAELVADPIDHEYQLINYSVFRDDYRDVILNTMKSTDFTMENQQLFDAVLKMYNNGCQFDTKDKYELILAFKATFNKMREKQDRFIDIRPEFSMEYILKSNYQVKLISQYEKITSKVNSLDQWDDMAEFITKSHNFITKDYDTRINKDQFDTRIQIVEDTLNYIESCQKGKETFLTWGITGLDNYIKLRPHCCYFVGAYNGVGKTAMAISCAIGQLRQGKSIALWCGEMTAEQIMMRFISQISGISIIKLEEKNALEHNQLQSMMNAVDEIKGFKLFLRCGDDLEMWELNNWIKHLVKFHDLDCVWLDYFTDIVPTTTTNNQQNRYELMGEIARQIKSLKKEIPIPIITLAQLNRNSDDRRPRKTDIAESSITERIADGIILIDRPIQGRDEGDRKYRWKNGLLICKEALFGKVILIVDKNRFGPQSVSYYDFLGETMEFGKELIAPPRIEDEDVPNG